MENTTKIFMSVDDLIKEENKELSPLPISVIPNYMGINLVSVEGLSWTKQQDGQLVDLTIHFKPENDKF
jgi:hypothetical protein